MLKNVRKLWARLGSPAALDSCFFGGGGGSLYRGGSIEEEGGRKSGEEVKYTKTVHFVSTVSTTYFVKPLILFINDEDLSKKVLVKAYVFTVFRMLRSE